MQSKELVRRVTEMALPICAQYGVSLWDVEFEKEGATHVLTLTIDRAEGVDLDHCEKVSRAIDPLLDAPAFASLPSYTLCVSSAGLARKLKKPAHFMAYLGHEVEVHFYKPYEGQKQLVGTLLAYDEGAMTIKAQGKEHHLTAGEVADVRLAVSF